MYRFITDTEDECSEDFNSSGERKPPRVEQPSTDLTPKLTVPGYALRVHRRWDIRVDEREEGRFTSRQAAFFCGVQLHENKPASFDAKAAETLADLMARLAANRRAARRNYTRVQ